MKNKWYLFALAAIFALLLAACQPAEVATTEAPEETEEPTEMATEEPTEVMTEEPTEMATEAASDLGTEDNPIIFSFVPSTDAAAVIASAEAIAEVLSEKTGYVIEANVPTDYVSAIEAMCAGEAHMGALATFAYAVASERDCADVALAAIRSGSSSYQGQIVVNADSGIETLEDLRGKTFCRVDEVSASGWIIPSIALRAAGIDPDTDLSEIVDSGAHDVVIRAVYAGDCDAGATFVDARDQVREDLPDVDDKVIPIATSAPIPNDGVAFHPDVPEDVRTAIVAALLEMSEDEETVQMLTALYRWNGLVEVDDHFYDEFRQFLDAANIDIEEYVK